MSLIQDFQLKYKEDFLEFNKDGGYPIKIWANDCTQTFSKDVQMTNEYRKQNA